MLTRTFAYYYYHILQYSPLLPLVYGMVRYRRMDYSLRLFLLYFAFSLALTFVMTILALQRINNLWVANTSPMIYAVIILWMFSLWQRSRWLTKVLRACIVAYALVWFTEVVVLDGWQEFTVVTLPLQGYIFLTVSCLTIYQLNKDVEQPLLDLPQFWISAGFILFYGGMILITLVSNRLLQISEETLRQALLIQPTLSLIAHLLFTGGLRCQTRLL